MIEPRGAGVFFTQELHENPPRETNCSRAFKYYLGSITDIPPEGRSLSKSPMAAQEIPGFIMIAVRGSTAPYDHQGKK